MKEISAFMIAGTQSGCGKTTVSIGIMALLKKMGLTVQPFKVGPDFIDPGHHKRVTGRPSHNLDGWMMSKQYNKRIFSYYCQDADVAVVEAVMGLYDGYSGRDEAGSSSQMAKWLNLPVILVVDASSMARSVAAIVLGYRLFDPELNICGVIFNKVAGEKHEEFIMEAMREIDGVEIIGFLKRRDEISIPSRHLGLVTAEDLRISEKEIDLLSEWIRDGLDIEKLLKITSGYKIVPLEDEEKKEKKVRIGIARDNAFCFYYEENLRLLEKEGAEIVTFSPLRDETLPEVDGLIFGGGYPELYAKELSENRRLMDEIRYMADKGMPIYAECGGFMYLMERIDEYKMVGIFPFRCSFKKRLVALGYREIVTKRDSIIGPSMTRARGHEFHYSDIVDKRNEVETIYQIKEREGKEGFLKKNVLGSYIHLHFGSNPDIPKNFVNSCIRFTTYE